MSTPYNFTMSTPQITIIKICSYVKNINPLSFARVVYSNLIFSNLSTKSKILSRLQWVGQVGQNRVGRGEAGGCVVTRQSGRAVEHKQQKFTSLSHLFDGFLLRCVFIFHVEQLWTESALGYGQLITSDLQYNI